MNPVPALDRAEFRRLLEHVRRSQPPRTSEEAYAQMERMNAFDRQVRGEDVRALALESEERRAATQETDLPPV